MAASKSGRVPGLRFSANFESGNIGKVAVINDHEYDIEIAPDTNNPRHRVWFYFSVSNIPFKNFRILLHVTNFSKSKSLYRDGMSPVVRSRLRPAWHRIPPKHVFYYRCPRHKRNYVMSFAFEFDRPDDEYFFAYSYPYTYTDLQRYLHGLDSRKLSFYRRELLCKTVQNRRLDLITISSGAAATPSDMVGAAPSTVGNGAVGNGAGAGAGAGASKAGGRRSKGSRGSGGGSSRTPSPVALGAKPMIFITARVHPGESPAQYVCQGLLDMLTSDTEDARALRSMFVFKIVPMLNPDGVFLGNYRCSYLGDDLNRHWLQPSAWAHREISATKELLMKYFADPDAHLDTFIDIHAHTTGYGAFMYCNSVADRARLESESLIPRLMHARCPDFSFQRTKFDQDNSKAGTGRRAVGALLAPRVSCYTLEVSFYAATIGYTGVSGKGSNHEVYTQDNYLKLGRDVALTFLDYHAAVAGQRAKAKAATAGTAGSRSRLHASDRANGAVRGVGMTGGTSSLTATPILSSSSLTATPILSSTAAQRNGGPGASAAGNGTRGTGVSARSSGGSKSNGGRTRDR